MDQAKMDFKLIKKGLLSRNTILLSIFVLLSFIIGLSLKTLDHEWSKRDLMYIGFIGELFLRCLKCLILPVIVTSIISSLCNLDSNFGGFIGCRATIYYLFTTIISIVLGIILVLIIQPGRCDVSFKESDLKLIIRETTSVDTLLDLIRNFIPSNIIEATFRTYKTVIISNNSNSNISSYDKDFAESYEESTNILGIIVISIIFGIALSKSNSSADNLRDLFESLNSTIMLIISNLIKLTPIGVSFLILPQILKVHSIAELLGSIGWYTFTVLLGIFIHGVLILPSIYFLCTKKNPYKFIASLSPALLTAFGTSSSSATLPVTITCLENFGLDSRIVRVLTPIGATINMDGTALYEAVAAIFIAQYRNVEMTLSKIIIISLTATAASIGAAGIPQAGLVTMVMVVNAVGLPVTDISLILVVDWFLDRFRTVINVMGDSIGCGVINHYSKNDLKKFPTLENDAL